MRLYNVTFKEPTVFEHLEPSIPTTAGNGEDKTTPRVCLCDTLENCIQAMASCSRSMEKGDHFWVRVVEVQGKNLLYPKELKEDNRVPDALENNEYWYLKKIPCETYECILGDFQAEQDFAWSCITVNQCKEIIERYTSEFTETNYENSHCLYEDFMLWAEMNRQWTIIDNVYEELMELPWATKLRVDNVLYSRVVK